MIGFVVTYDLPPFTPKCAAFSFHQYYYRNEQGGWLRPSHSTPRRVITTEDDFLLMSICRLPVQIGTL